jgi:hypothetical protein
MELGSIHMTNDTPPLFWTVDCAQTITCYDRNYAAEIVRRLSPKLSTESKYFHTLFVICWFNDNLLFMFYVMQIRSSIDVFQKMATKAQLYQPLMV